MESIMESYPLAGIRVLDLSRLLPGPYLTQLLADLGAEVIKIETPRLGDYARIAPPEMGLGGMFEAVNRGKKRAASSYGLPVLSWLLAVMMDVHPGPPCYTKCGECDPK
jgi:hypothetical protein